MRPPQQSNLRPPVGCLALLLIFSAFVAVAAYPSGVSILGAAFGGVALLCIFLKFGWWVPFTIAGCYFGMFILDPAVKGGDLEYQMRETANAIVTGTILGSFVGAVIDVLQTKDNDPPA